MSQPNKIKEPTIEEFQTLVDALYGVLDSSRLDIAKEIAADALDTNLEEYISMDDSYGVDDLEFFEDAIYTQDDNILLTDWD